MKADSINILRDALVGLSPGAKHDPKNPPASDEIYAPREHIGALDPERAVVVGNRGVGKTFWTTALADESVRKYLSTLPVYSRLNLQDVDVIVGFHGSYSDIAPSVSVIEDCERENIRPRRIWEAVLLRYLGRSMGLGLPENLKECALWLENNIEAGERVIREADTRLTLQGKRLLIIFDALDTLGSNWADLRRRLEGLIEFARLAKGLRAIKPKMFLRVDQTRESDLWTSPDASKLYNERVHLRWHQHALYELLFLHLNRTPELRNAFTELTGMAWQALVLSEQDHRAAFSCLAGASMGGGRNRGNTYDWVTNHLADTNMETTPRAFLGALRAAAEHHPDSRSGVIDHLDIQHGVAQASDARLAEIRDEYWWVPLALEHLEGATVPCVPEEIWSAWKDAGTCEEVLRSSERRNALPPLALTWDAVSLPGEVGGKYDTPEKLLALNLMWIGILEQRTNGKYNIPDIFRVGARIKRRGGIKPPPRPRQRRWGPGVE